MFCKSNLSMFYTSYAYSFIKLLIKYVSSFNAKHTSNGTTKLFSTKFETQQTSLMAQEEIEYYAKANLTNSF